MSTPITREELRVKILKLKGWKYVTHPMLPDACHFLPSEEIHAGYDVFDDAPNGRQIRVPKNMPHPTTDIAAAWPLLEDLRTGGTASAALICRAIRMADTEWRTVYAVEAVIANLTLDIICLVWVEMKTGTTYEIQETI